MPASVPRSLLILSLASAGGLLAQSQPGRGPAPDHINSLQELLPRPLAARFTPGEIEQLPRQIRVEGGAVYLLVNPALRPAHHHAPARTGPAEDAGALAADPTAAAAAVARILFRDRLPQIPPAIVAALTADSESNAHRQIETIGREFIGRLIRNVPSENSLAEIVGRATDASKSVVFVVALDAACTARPAESPPILGVDLQLELFRLTLAAKERRIESAELLFSDRATGEAPIAGAGEPAEVATALRAAAVDALRDRLAVSFCDNGLLRQDWTTSNLDPHDPSLLEAARAGAAANGSGGGR